MIKEYMFEIADICFAKRNCEDIDLLESKLLPAWTKLKSIGSEYDYVRFKIPMMKKDVDLQDYAIGELITGMREYFEIIKDQAIYQEEYTKPPYAFVIFKSMKAKEAIEKFYSTSRAETLRY